MGPGSSPLCPIDTRPIHLSLPPTFHQPPVPATAPLRPSQPISILTTPSFTTPHPSPPCSPSSGTRGGTGAVVVLAEPPTVAPPVCVPVSRPCPLPHHHHTGPPAPHVRMISSIYSHLSHTERRGRRQLFISLHHSTRKGRGWKEGEGNMAVSIYDPIRA